MNKHKLNKRKENSNTVRHLIIGQIITTQNLVAIKEVRHAGQSNKIKENSYTVRHLIMEQIITTQNLVAIKEVRHAGQ